MISPTTYLSKWSKWIYLRLAHKAPGVKVVDMIDMTPCDQTKTFLDKINAVFRKHNDGYAIFKNDLLSENLINNLTIIPKKLIFEGKINNKDFLLLSNTDFLANRLQVSYINNLGQKPIDESISTLNSKEYLDPEELEILDLVPKTYSFTIEQKIKPESVTFYNVMQQRLDDVKLTIINGQNNQSIIQCDFTESEVGACIIKINDKENRKIFVSEKKQLNLVVELFINPGKKLPELFKNKLFQTQNFKLAYDTKNTFWRYILISRSEEKNVYDINEVSFDLNGEKITINTLEKRELVNGVRCIYATFKDEKPLRINTFNHEILRMKIINAKKWNQSSIRMPIPTYKNVQRFERENGKNYSLMYVYI